jgi:hypothetical protein
MILLEVKTADAVLSGLKIIVTPYSSTQEPAAITPFTAQIPPGIIFIKTVPKKIFFAFIAQIIS